MKNVLIVCTGNSCRSIMAQCLVNHLCKDNYNAASAGSFPAGYVHSKSIATMRRHGIDIGEPRSKSWDEFTNHEFGLVITVCDRAANETCPALLGKTTKLHWSTPDPAQAKGSEDEIDAAFDAVYQMFKERIEGELL